MLCRKTPQLSAPDPVFHHVILQVFDILLFQPRLPEQGHEHACFQEAENALIGKVPVQDLQQGKLGIHHRIICKASVVIQEIRQVIFTHHHVKVGGKPGKIR